MNAMSKRHGCLLVMLWAAAAAAAVPDDPTRVPSRVFEIQYEINAEAQPLESVQLWYTLDRGRSWHLYGADEDRQSPFAFNAPAEGLYGFFFVVSNATGASSNPPDGNTQAHHWVFVDYTPPVVQVHPPRPTTVMGKPVVQVRWTAVDTHLESRPIELSYCRPPDRRWYPLTDVRLPNTGRYDWRVPHDLTGTVELRVSVTDKGGHHAEALSAAFELQGVNAPDPAGQNAATMSSHLLEPSAPTTAARSRAANLYAQALNLRDRGDDEAAIKRLREAGRLDPEFIQAFAALAPILYRTGNPERALDAYKIVLRQEPNQRTALRGAAQIETQQRDYSSAEGRLRQILQHNPNDVEVWMHLGDLALLQGDELSSREHYLRAMTLDPKATGVIGEAKKRFELLDSMSRKYTRSGNP